MTEYYWGQGERMKYEENDIPDYKVEEYNIEPIHVDPTTGDLSPGSGYTSFPEFTDEEIEWLNSQEEGIDPEEGLERFSCANCGGPVQHTDQAYCSGSCQSEYESEVPNQVGGDHYEKLGIDPFAIVLGKYGAIGLEAALVCKIMKYVLRDKDSDDLDKALDCMYRLRDLRKEPPF